MTPNEICLRLNGHELSQFVTVVGTPPDLRFFEDNLRTARGKHTVNFSVGGRYIRNRVSFRGPHVDIWNDFEPFAISEFIDAERKRVAAEQEKARFLDAIEGVFYLNAKTILNLELLPTFDKSILSKDPQGTKFFVSHRWQSPDHPDPKGEHLALLKQHASGHPTAHYWVDYSCLPQPRLVSDSKMFDRTLPKLTSIQSGASTLVIMDDQYLDRLWCHVEHYIGVLFSQANFGEKRRTIEYLGHGPADARELAESVQMLREPEWGRLRVTKESDIPFIQENWRFLTNILKFQLVDRFVEVFRTLPGKDLYCASGHFPQSVFGLSYPDSLGRISSVFRKFDWRTEAIYEENSLVRTAALLAHSDEFKKYEKRELRFSKYLFHEQRQVAYLAMLLALVRHANRFRFRVKYLRTLYAKIVIMSMFC